MSEPARPESIVPAPPQVFRQWVKRQALIAVGITVCVIGFFVIRLILRERNALSDFAGHRIWVADAPSPGSYGTPDAVAREPGGRPIGLGATVMPQIVQWTQNATTPTSWDCVTLTVEDDRRLVRSRTRPLGSFAILGEKRVIDGVVWQEAWRMEDHPIAARPDAATALTTAGDWQLDGASDMPALVRLDRDGDARVVPDEDSEETDAWHGTWTSADGVFRIDEHPVAAGRRGNGYRSFIIGRLAPDGRSFTGFETSGAAVTGTRVK